MREHATYAQVAQAITDGKLRVDVVTGRAYYRRPNPKAIWRPCSAELVAGPHQAKPYVRVSFAGLRCLLHRVVWFAARGSIPEGLEPNHRNGNKLDNAITNLELVTPTRNIEHAIETGLLVPRTGFRGIRAKLTDAQVVELRARLARGERQIDLAPEYGIAQSQISRIASGYTYRPIKACPS